MKTQRKIGQPLRKTEQFQPKPALTYVPCEQGDVLGMVIGKKGKAYLTSGNDKGGIQTFYGEFLSGPNPVWLHPPEKTPFGKNERQLNCKIGPADFYYRFLELPDNAAENVFAGLKREEI